MHEVSVLAAARLELRDAIAWYRGQSPASANRFALEVKSAVEAIRQHPDQQLRWDDQYHFYLLDKFPYFVAYRRTSDLVVIVAIRHASQDQDAWRGR